MVIQLAIAVNPHQFHNDQFQILGHNKRIRLLQTNIPSKELYQQGTGEILALKQDVAVMLGLFWNMSVKIPPASWNCSPLDYKSEEKFR